MAPYLTPLWAEELAAAGVPLGWPFGIRDRVRFSEIDALGHVNNASYLSWFEGFRLSYLKDYGISDYGPDAPRLVLRTVGLEFLREMLVNEDYVVTGRTLWYRTSSFFMEYGVFAPDLRVKGTAVVVLRTPDGQGKWPLTADQKKTLGQRDGARLESSAPP
ncbi:MAG: acyl-CoA thioesterase [Pseudomonadota bacterium]